MNCEQNVAFFNIKYGWDKKWFIYVFLHWTALYPQGTTDPFLYKWCLSTVKMFAVC